MPLITRNSQNANVKLGTTAQLAAITFTDGDLASDTTLNKVKVFNGVSLAEIGATSFSSSAVVSQSTTIGNYTTPSAVLATSPSATVEYLVIGGGGGASTGAGGAGGYQTASGFSVSSGTYSITVGAGGAGTTAGVQSNNGQDSIFSTITSIGGGRGGQNTTNGSNGGSGGGSGASDSAKVGGSGTVGQGKNGGNTNHIGAPYSAAGGGGASTAGANTVSNSVAGAGGAGLASSITGTSVTRGGGGGGGLSGTGTGGAGGSGGGGNGSNNGNGTSGTANTGGGGGGCASSGTGGTGGSGIVIIRYLSSVFSATGGTITTDGSYTIHSFTSSGSFVIPTFGADLAIDNNTATKWTSSSESNPNIYVDMGSALNLCAAAFYFDSTDTTNTEILIQSSPDASVWTTRRTITESNLIDGAYNYYRFNIAGGARYIRFYGNSAGSTVLSIWEIKILKKTDAEIFNDLGILSITASDTALGPDGT